MVETSGGPDCSALETERVLQIAAAEAVLFRSRQRDRLQRPDQTYAQCLANFDGPTPEAGMATDEAISELIAKATPGLHATTGPRFFGWVIGGSHPVGVAADWLTAAWGQNAGNHTASPAAAAAETVAARWLLDILRLPGSASVGFVTGATVANFVCLTAARWEVLRRAGWNVESDGIFGAPRITVLIGEDAHSTVFAALQYLGFGQSDLRRIETDGQGAIVPRAFDEALSAAPGPVIAITQAGQLNTGAVDPHGPIVEAARRHPNCWMHVDGAFGLWARASLQHRALVEGVEGADSWATDGHKWLQTPYDSGYAIVRDGEAHRRAMTIQASYLPPVGEGERDPSHFVPELSRRARGFSTWAMLRHLGRDGIAAMVERHCAIARMMAGELATEPGIAVLNEVVLNQVIIRFGDDRPAPAGDLLTKSVIEGVQATGVLFAGGTIWHGQWAMRISVIGYSTTDADARLSVDAIKATWRRVAAASS